MQAEAAVIRQVEKPWGMLDLGPWGTNARSCALIGELWFERRDARAADASLLLKVLLTSQALSVQVHPDDQYARAIGLPNGKTEAWYILSAEADAQVAVGLKVHLTRAALRSAIVDGSIGGLLAWRSVAAGDVVLVPAGTIHAIGAGIVLVEIQQNSDTTFRILDPGHGRPLDVEHAAACAHTEPAEPQKRPERLSAERSLLVSSQHFIFESMQLPPGSEWHLQAEFETWLYGLSGSAHAAGHDISAGNAVFAEATQVDLRVGSGGVACLVAYPGHRGPSAHLLSRQCQATGIAALPHGGFQAAAQQD